MGTRFRVTALYVYISACTKCASGSNSSISNRGGGDSSSNSDVWLTVHRNSVWIRKTNYMSLFVFFISLLIVAQHVSGNHVPVIRS